MSKLIVIVGITGNQGGSVANAFLQHSQWRVRGLTRDITSEASRALQTKGVEMVQADLHSPESLVSALKGGNLIFSVTDFWKPFFNPSNIVLAQGRNVSIGQLCYELEYEQGKNIVDAASHPDILAHLGATGLIASTLSSARECSKGKYQQLYHYDSKADIFPKYVEEKYPELAKKTSYMQTGYFMSSWNYMPHLWPGKQPADSEKKFVVRMATAPEAVQPHLDVSADTGHYVYALAQMGPGQTVMAAGEWCTWPEWIAKWANAMGFAEDDVRYEQLSADDASALIGGDFGREVAEMYEYSSWPGYDGGVPMLKGDDLQKVRLRCHVAFIAMSLTVNFIDGIKHPDDDSRRVHEEDGLESCAERVSAAVNAHH